MRHRRLPRTARRALLLAAAAAILLPGTPALSAQADTAAPAASLSPGDVVRVRIWREPDLSGEFTVDETGTVVLPRLGPVQARGADAGALRGRLVESYAAFLNHRSVEITFLRRIQVLGAVRTPGLYPVDATMTLGDALALAGGTTPQGHPDRVLVVRRGAARTAATRRTLVSDTPLRSGDQLYVPERSWISRNPGVVAGIVSAAVGLLAAVAR